MPYTVTKNAWSGSPAFTANRTYEGTRDALRSIENATVSNISLMSVRRFWRDGPGRESRRAWSPNGFSTNG